MTKQHRSKLSQDIYLQYFVTKPSWLLFGTDTAQYSSSPAASVIFVKYVCNNDLLTGLLGPY